MPDFSLEPHKPLIHASLSASSEACVARHETGGSVRSTDESRNNEICPKWNPPVPRGLVCLAVNLSGGCRQSGRNVTCYYRVNEPENRFAGTTMRINDGNS